MGAGASLIPESLDLEAARAAAGDRFDEAAFHQAAVDGVVTREAFLAAVASSPPAIERTASGRQVDAVGSLPSLVKRLPSHDQGLLQLAYGNAAVKSKPKASSRVVWRSTATLAMAADDSLDVARVAETVGDESLADCQAFVAEAVLGPKDTKWQVRGITLAPSKPHPSGTQKMVLAMHGHSDSCSCLDWSRFFGALSRDGFRVVAFDAPCFGRSSGDATGQANLWRSDDAKLVVGLLEAFRCPPGGAHVLGHCMGGAMFLRALSLAPALFAHAHVLNNCTIAAWPEETARLLEEKGGSLLAYHDADADHMREAVACKMLSKLARERPELCTFVDCEHEVEAGKADPFPSDCVPDAASVSRTSEVFVYDPTESLRRRVSAHLLSKPRVSAAERSAMPKGTVLDAEGRGSNANFRVLLRIRPPIERELAASAGGSCKRGYTLKHEKEGPDTITVQSGNKTPFTFERAFDEGATEADVFSGALQPLMEALIAKGRTGTLFAYGQTGSGKTYTLEHAVRLLAEYLLSRGDAGAAHTPTLSFYEIYEDNAYDLLAEEQHEGGGSSSGALAPRDGPDGLVTLPGLLRRRAATPSEMVAILDEGMRRRTTAATLMNRSSSRSHAVFTLSLSSSGNGSDGRHPSKGATLHIVDLAGSERVKRSGASGKTLEQAAAINTSLAALVRVVRACVQPDCQHIPYRDSLLTRVLRDAIGGESMTVMIACTSPAADSASETERTVRFAATATHVRNAGDSDEFEEVPVMGAKEESTIAVAAERTASAFGAGGSCTVPAKGSQPALHCRGVDAPDASPTTPTLVLLHYYAEGASNDMWEASTFAAANAAGVRVIAPSFPGWGQSGGSKQSAKADPAGFNSKGGAVETVTHLLDHFGARKAVLLGFDWGGGVALQYALEKANRVSGVVFWNGSYRELDALKPLCRMRVPLACCRHEDEWFPKRKAEAFAEAIGVKVTNVDGEGDVVKVALKMLAQSGKGSKKGKAKKVA